MRSAAGTIPSAHAEGPEGAVIGSAVSGQATTRTLDRLGSGAGVVPHDLRRSCITTRLDRGTDAVLVARMVGHASVDTTRVYDRRGEKAVIEAAGAVAFPW